MKRSFLTIVIASALLTAAPASVFAQAKAAPAATAAKAGSPSQLVLANSTRILTTLEARRGEFTKNRAALRAAVQLGGAGGEFLAAQCLRQRQQAELVVGVGVVVAGNGHHVLHQVESNHIFRSLQRTDA